VTFKSRLLLSVAASLIGAAPIAAQTTNIQSSAGALNLGTNAAQAGTTVTITGGTAAGPNLFHSFSNFDLAAGHRAVWQATQAQATSVLNLVNRVTGADPARISGTLDSRSFANANFYSLALRASSSGRAQRFRFRTASISRPPAA
jgi:filamentous hemagglutinin family protein